MPVTTVLFDLDGTLLPMDQEKFVKAYFGLLAKKLAPRGYQPEKLIQAIWSGTAAMVKNQGEGTNEQVFWKHFCGLFGEEAMKDLPVFDDYYRHEFQQVQSSCGFAPQAKEAIEAVKEKGLQCVLATNPIFPAIATQSRIRWAGLKEENFLFYTTYENSCHCKPNPAYYADILEKLGVPAGECLMVGNDVGEDMIAEKLGMQVFLLTDCLINKEGKDISAYPHGGFKELISFLRTLNA